MTQSRITKMIPVECWDCGEVSHVHKTLTAATRCAKAQQRRKPKPLRDIPLATRVDITLAILHGEPVSSVAADYRVGKYQINIVWRDTLQQAHTAAGCSSYPTTDIRYARWFRGEWEEKLRILEESTKA